MGLFLLDVVVVVSFVHCACAIISSVFTLFCFTLLCFVESRGILMCVGENVADASVRMMGFWVSFAWFVAR